MLRSPSQHEHPNPARKAATTTELKKQLIARYESVLPKSTERSIRKNRKSIRSATLPKKTTVKDEMEKRLLAWVEAKQFAGDVFSEKLVCGKARTLYEQLRKKAPDGCEFKASRGWFNSFRKRAGINGIVKPGTTIAGVNKEKFAKMFAELVERERLVPEQVFGCVETRLSWRADADDRLSLLLCGNATGSCKVKPLVMYEETTEWFDAVFVPTVTSFLAVRNLPRKALLVTHRFIKPTVDFIKILPTSDATQPMTQIVPAFEELYAGNVESGDFPHDVERCSRIIDAAWDELSPKTIRSSWRKLYPALDENPQAAEQVVEPANDDTHEERAERNVSGEEIEELCEAWARVERTVAKLHPDKAAARSGIDSFNLNVMDYFRSVRESGRIPPVPVWFSIDERIEHDCADASLDGVKTEDPLETFERIDVKTEPSDSDEIPHPVAGVKEECDDFEASEYFVTDADVDARTYGSNAPAHDPARTGENPCRCEVCGKAFIGQSKLKRHRLVHTGEKPHRCGKCGNDYADLQTLRRHWLSHTGEKPYGCEVCGRRFADKQYLKRHGVLHTREIRCEVCRGSFASVKALRKHETTHR